jgi:hypothetical protein
VSQRWKIGLYIVSASILAFAILLVGVSVETSRHMRDWVAAWLAQHYNSSVEISSFDLKFAFPTVQCEARNLVLHFRDRKDLPPLIRVDAFTVQTSVWGILRNPRRIDSVLLQGLQLNIPPREERAGSQPEQYFLRRTRGVRFREIRAKNAVLKVLTKKPGKLPHEFDIRDLRLSSIGSDGILSFRAQLTNPAPPGEIASSGTFGPWNVDTPSETPVSGHYTFEHADLGVFRGIAGILSSEGNYQGVLDAIRVEGTTKTPDFQVTRAGRRVDLSTTFEAVVNGTDGDTYLHSVKSHFGKTDLVAQGKVERTSDRPGRTITLEVSAEHGRIEDLLRLSVKAPTPMEGPVRLQATFLLSPGPKDILDRLHLDGSFDMNSVRFTNTAVQQRVDNMSKRGLGEPKEVRNPENAIPDDDVASAVSGKFRLQDGVLALSGVRFGVPGAGVQVSGTYTLAQEALDLHGTLTMQAKLSQATTGAKSFFLRLADPFFSKKGQGTVLPIRITGSVQHPQYGLNLRRARQGSDHQK